MFVLSTRSFVLRRTGFTMVKRYLCNCLFSQRDPSVYDAVVLQWSNVTCVIVCSLNEIFRFTTQGFTTVSQTKVFSLLIVLRITISNNRVLKVFQHWRRSENTNPCNISSGLGAALQNYRTVYPKSPGRSQCHKGRRSPKAQIPLGHKPCMEGCNEFVTAKYKASND